MEEAWYCDLANTIKNARISAHDQHAFDAFWKSAWAVFSLPECLVQDGCSEGEQYWVIKNQKGLEGFGVCSRCYYARVAVVGFGDEMELVEVEEGDWNATFPFRFDEQTRW